MSNILLQWSQHIKVSVETLTSNWWRETETQNKLPSCCHSVPGLEPRPCSPPSPKHSVSQNALDHVFDGKQVWGTGQTDFRSPSRLSHLFRKAEEQCRHQTAEPCSHQAGIMKQTGSKSPALISASNIRQRKHSGLNNHYFKSRGTPIQQTFNAIFLIWPSQGTPNERQIHFLELSRAAVGCGLRSTPALLWAECL